MTVNTVLTPSMTSSNSMSSGYCSLDDESEDFTFFTAKTSFFRKPRHTAKVQNGVGAPPLIDVIVGAKTNSSESNGVLVRLENKLPYMYEKQPTRKQKYVEEVAV